MSNSHSLKINIVIDWDHERVIIIQHCSHCGESQVELSLSHLPSIHSALTTVLTELEEEIGSPLIGVTPAAHIKVDMTQEEAEVFFRKGRN